MLIAIAIGDAERLAPVLTSMECTYLYKVVTEREVGADCNRTDLGTTFTIERLSVFEPDPADWDLKGESFVEALTDLVEQLAITRGGGYHNYLGDAYSIEVSGSERAAYVSIITWMAGEDDETFERTFEYEREATLDGITPRCTRKACSALPIWRASTLTSSHVKMMAEILATARDRQIAGLVH